MNRRSFTRKLAGSLLLAGLPVAPRTRPSVSPPRARPHGGPGGPVFVYNNWSAYDELSDNVFLDETLAMNQLDQVLRLRDRGARFDYYVMDAFWFEADGGYRTWRRESWPDGGDRWIDACLAEGIQPGLWISVNTVKAGEGYVFLRPIREWADSVAPETGNLCLFDGGYLAHLAETLQQTIDRGISAFKFDFADFSAATQTASRSFTPEEIVAQNQDAFFRMLKLLRTRNPHILLTAFNGFGGQYGNTQEPFRKTVDLRWLEVFDALYCGDPRFSDVPMANLWRSEDLYTDHMVRNYEANGVPLQRIDNTGFMLATTGTSYYRKTSGWKGMTILLFARGGDVSTIYGRLDLLSDEDVAWFSRTQRLYLDLLEYGKTSSFGGWPGDAEPFGYLASTRYGSVATVVNPGQAFREVELPASGDGFLLFADAGFVPTLSGNTIVLGPEQMAVVGFGGYADPAFDLGIGDTHRIPVGISPLPATPRRGSGNDVTVEVDVPAGMSLRILAQQFTASGRVKRSSAGSPPHGTPLDRLLRLEVMQRNRAVPFRTEYDRAIWSGLSWAAAEIPAEELTPGAPVLVRFSSSEAEPLNFEVRLFGVAW